MVIRLFSSLQLAGLTSRVEVAVPQGGTVKDALDGLFQRIPGLRAHMLVPGRDQVRPEISLILRGERLQGTLGMQKPVTDEDILAIFPPMTGG